MSNRLYIETTEFKRNNNTTYGIIISDSYEENYLNTLSKEEFNQLGEDDKKIYDIAENNFSDYFWDLDMYSQIYINDNEVLEYCDKCDSKFLTWEIEMRMFEDEVGNGLTEFEVCPKCKEKYDKRRDY